MEKCRLKLLGITYNQIESGVYAVILEQYGGTRRIPIIIGFSEAQAIETKLQEVVTPRPLTHDMTVNLLSAFGISLHEINIYRMPNGVFGASMILSDGSETHVVDARSSDAIALAIRVGAPIYTSPEVLEEAGFEPGEDSQTPHVESRRPESLQPTANTDSDLEARSLAELHNDMQRAAEREDYEEAARIKAEIELRVKSGKTGGSDSLPF